jgi:hypothetical protein
MIGARSLRGLGSGVPCCTNAQLSDPNLFPGDSGFYVQADLTTIVCDSTCPGVASPTRNSDGTLIAGTGSSSGISMATVGIVIALGVGLMLLGGK